MELFNWNISKVDRIFHLYLKEKLFEPFRSQGNECYSFYSKILEIYALTRNCLVWFGFLV